MEERKRFKPVEKFEYTFGYRLMVYFANILRAIKEFPPRHFDAAWCWEHDGTKEEVIRISVDVIVKYTGLAMESFKELRTESDPVIAAELNHEVDLDLRIILEEAEELSKTVGEA